MKKFLSALIAATLVCSFASAAAAEKAAEEKPINVSVNGKAVKFTDAQPFVDDNYRTMVPLRAIADALDIEVTWDQATQTARFYKSYTADTAFYKWDDNGDGVKESYIKYQEISFINHENYYNDKLILRTFGDPTFDENGKVIDDGQALRDIPGNQGGENSMDTKAISIKGRMYAPIKYLAESFGKDVVWEAKTSTVKVVDALELNYKYYYDVSIKAAELRLIITDPKNFSTANIKSVYIDDEKAEIEKYTADEIKADKAKGYNAIDGVKATYKFAKDGVYDIIVEFDCIDNNGAEKSKTINFSYTAE